MTEVIKHFVLAIKITYCLFSCIYFVLCLSYDFPNRPVNVQDFTLGIFWLSIGVGLNSFKDGSRD